MAPPGGRLRKPHWKLVFMKGPSRMEEQKVMQEAIPPGQGLISEPPRSFCLASLLVRPPRRWQGPGLLCVFRISGWYLPPMKGDRF